MCVAASGARKKLGSFQNVSDFRSVRGCFEHLRLWRNNASHLKDGRKKTSVPNVGNRKGGGADCFCFRTILRTFDGVSLLRWFRAIFRTFDSVSLLRFRANLSLRTFDIGLKWLLGYLLTLCFLKCGVKSPAVA